MQTYRNVGPRGAVTPQSEPIPGSAQVKNDAGGFVWEVDDWTRLERFLILGTEGGSYYANAEKMTKENAQVVERCIKADGLRTVDMIETIAVEHRAAKTDQGLLALAMCMKHGDDLTRQAAFSSMRNVVRYGTQLLHFLSFAEQFRGWGRGLRKAVSFWFNNQPVRDLAYQVTKYQSRDGWAMRDALRLAHPHPETAERDLLYGWIVGKGAEWATMDTSLGHYMQAVEHIKTLGDKPTEAANLIRLHKLAREVVPTDLLKHTDVWGALLDEMPMMAMVRNLATMTRIGLLTAMSNETQTVIERLGNAEIIRRSHIHPISILNALLTYQRGVSARGDGRWTPVPRIVDALDDAFYKAFANVEPTGARTLLALDVSGSMDQGEIAGMPGLSPRVAAAAMAMVTYVQEPRVAAVAFTGNNSFDLDKTKLHPVAFTPRSSLAQVTAELRAMPMGQTDCALPMDWARENKLQVDTFIIYTDNQTWVGRKHPAQALRDYRQAMGIQAKLIVVGMLANAFSIADPNDAGMMDVIGFDTSAPALITDFSRVTGA